MTAQIIDGKAFAARLREKTALAVADLIETAGVQPGLAVVIVGEDAASQIYVRNKGEQTIAAGMASFTHRLLADTAETDLLALVAQLNADPTVHGILVQLPLPPQINAGAALAAIHPDKDVDGFHVVNAGRLATGQPGPVPCTPLGCRLLLQDVMGDLAGANAVVIGRSNIVGKPMGQLLLQADCTVTIAHSRTRDLPALCGTADILVAATGRPLMVKGEWIKPGAAVIDVGINRLPARDPDAAAAGKTRLVGDVDFASACEVAGWITPVPGGVGPMTIACLLSNTLTACRRQLGLESIDLR